MADIFFSFIFVTEDEARELIMNLDGSKTTPNGDISAKILKSTADIHSFSIYSKHHKPVNKRRLFS